MKKIVKALLGKEEIGRMEFSIQDNKPIIEKVIIKKGFDRKMVYDKMKQELEKVLEQ